LGGRFDRSCHVAPLDDLANELSELKRIPEKAPLLDSF
jgi:hypothetical protein